MRERECTPYLKSLVESKGGILFRIPDDPLGFGGRRPFDYFGALPGVGIFFEAKMARQATSPRLRPSAVKPHQLQALQLVKERLPDAIVGIVLFWQPRPRARISLYFVPIDALNQAPIELDRYLEEVLHAKRTPA